MLADLVRPARDYELADVRTPRALARVIGEDREPPAKIVVVGRALRIAAFGCAVLDTLKHPEFDEHTVADAARVPPGPPVVTRAPSGGGSVIYETLPEADPVTSPSHAAPAPERRELPTADEMLAGGVPELRLELHVFSSVSADRFAFINSRKYREGDTLQEGPRVDEITRDGVVLDFRGRRFLLPRE